MKNNVFNTILNEEGCNLDLTIKGVSANENPKLILVSKRLQTRRPLPPPSQQIKIDRSDDYTESLDNLKTDRYEEAPSSLSIYLKTINRFPLLSGEEERILGKRIKDCEEKCKDLILKWKHLFKNRFLRVFFVKDKKTVNEELQRINDTLNLFDNLTELEKERRQVESALQDQNQNLKVQEKLQEALYKIMAEIAKCITKIIHSKIHIEKTVHNLNDIPSKKQCAIKRQYIENDLRRILQDISRLSEEIKKLKSVLVDTNQKLVSDIAKKYSHYGLELADIIQEGNLGLIRAIDTFDYRRGYRFMSYATWWIRQGIIRALQSKLRTIRKPNHLNEKLREIEKTSQRLYQECKREPTLDEIAKEIDVPLESVEEVTHSFKDPLSLDPLTEAHRECVTTYFSDHKRNSILERVISSSLSEIIDVVLSELTQREREVVKLRFGIGGCDHHTLEEIGEKFDFTRERSRQILTSALNKMKKSKHMISLREFRNVS